MGRICLDETSIAENSWRTDVISAIPINLFSIVHYVIIS